MIPPAQRLPVQPRSPAAPAAPPAVGGALEAPAYLDRPRDPPAALAARVHVDDRRCLHGAHDRSPPSPNPGPRGTRFKLLGCPACRADREATPLFSSSRKRM